MSDFGNVISEQESAESVDGGRQQQQPEIEATEQESAEPLSIGQINEEIRAIELRMKTDRRAYFADNAAQARYRELLTLREKHEKGTEDKPSDDDDGPGLPEDLIKEWEENGGVALNLSRAQDVALEVIENLTGDEQTELLLGFEELPVTAQSRVYAHMAIPPPVGRPATQETMERFASTEDGAELVREWGRDAARNVAVLYSRVETILNSLSPEDRGRVNEWLNALSPKQAKAIGRALVGKRR